MDLTRLEERTLTDLDHLRLSRLIDPATRAPLAACLDAADVVPSRSVAPDVVTMYSTVLLADLDSGARYRLTPCYPNDAEPAAGFVSVLSPVGASLLGLRVGAVARWNTPDGRTHRAEVLALAFQPEASGDFSL